MALRATRSRLARLALLFGLLALLLSACDLPWQAKPSDLAKDQTLRMAWSTGGGPDITTLDPAQCSDTSCIQLVSLLYDGLVTVDSHEHIKPWAARSWTISPDGLTYTFKLQPNQKFSDGAPVKPSDYAWSMDRAVNPCLGSQLSYYLAIIKDASAFIGETCANGLAVGAITTLVGDSVIPDDSANTLTIKLERPAAYFLAALTYSTSFAVEKSVVTGDDLGRDDTWLDNLAKGEHGQGGSGMFYVSAWDHQGVLTLKANPHWWGLRAGKKPNFTTVDFKLFSSTDTEYSTYQNDLTLAYTDTIPMDRIFSAKSRPDYHELPALINLGVTFNWRLAPFDDINARKAFCLAINREQLNQQVYQNAIIPSWHIVPKGMPGYNANLQGLDGAATTGDAALARQYWQRYLVAHQNTVPRITFSDRSFSQLAQAAISLYEESWSQVLGVSVTTYVVHTIFDETRSQQMFRFGWQADYPDPQDFLSLLFLSDAPYNTQSASVPAADALMRQADTLPDMRQRVPLYNQAEQLLIDNVAVCPLYQYVTRYALRSWVKGGFEEDARGLFPNDAWVSGYIAKH
ncbi:MAG TPA: peptide ABC transporter substrate-binding protein [Ktedonobacterales bacterium]|nr:peptide ABC transporter substrate-binding protein [Ktedonobacterales bacterium]